jgi:Domain of unknown function (DUF4124)
MRCDVRQTGVRRQAGKAPIWVMLLLGALGGMVLYWYSSPQAVPSWVRGWLPGLPEYTGPLYRWYDDRGRMQVTDTPPRGRPYETVTYRSDANVTPPRGEAQRP